MTLAAPLPPEYRPDRVGAEQNAADRAAADRVGELQSRIRGMQARRLDTREIPTHPALAAVLPGGALREGTVVQAAGSTSLVMALLAGPSAAGRWAAVVGMPAFGAEAARRFGIDLSRLVLVPEPGSQWLAVAATLADTVPVVVVRPEGRVSPGEVSRLAARIRQRGALLIATGAWPGADTVLEVTGGRWSGLEPGHGALTEREVVVRAAGRGGFGPRVSARLRLPDAPGGVASAEAGMPLAEVHRIDERRAG